MKVGLLPKVSKEVAAALAKPGPVPQVVVRYCFDSIGRIIAMGERKIGVILQTRVILDYPGPDGSTSRRCYSVVSVRPEQEEYIRGLLNSAQGLKSGIVDLSETAKATS